jgi:hypothetical protein
MKPSEQDRTAGFPPDTSTITGVRIESLPWVVPVDTGTAELVTIGGQTWLRWEQGGVQRAVNTRHIVEVLSTASLVVDLQDQAEEFAHQIDAPHATKR